MKGICRLGNVFEGVTVWSHFFLRATLFSMELQASVERIDTVYACTISSTTNESVDIHGSDSKSVPKESSDHNIFRQMFFSQLQTIAWEKTLWFDALVVLKNKTKLQTKNWNWLNYFDSRRACRGNSGIDAGNEWDASSIWKERRGVQRICWEDCISQSSWCHTVSYLPYNTWKMKCFHLKVERVTRLTKHGTCESIRRRFWVW